MFLKGDGCEAFPLTVYLFYFMLFYFLAERISVFNIPEVLLMLILGYDGGNGDQVLFMIDLDEGVPQSSIKQAYKPLISEL